MEFITEHSINHNVRDLKIFLTSENRLDNGKKYITSWTSITQVLEHCRHY